MIKNKIEIMLSSKNKMKKDLQEMLQIDKQPSFSRKLNTGAFNVDEFLKICEWLDMEVIIQNKSSGEVITKLGKEDIRF